jgi:hypothetical protein
MLAQLGPGNVVTVTRIDALCDKARYYNDPTRRKM